MSYLRGNWYAWDDGRRLHIWCRRPEDDVTAHVHSCDFAAGVAVPDAIMEDLAVLLVAELEAEGRRAMVERRAVRRWGGNVGASALVEKVTGLSATDWWERRREQKARQGKKAP